MPIRLTDLAKRLFRRPVAKPQRTRLELQSLEDRVVPTATVTVAAISDGTEGGSSGLFRLTRTETTGSLSVSISTSGSAYPNNDYTSLGSSVTFASGSATADVTVTPIDDSAIEGDETVTLTINYYYNYFRGNPYEATVTIHDNDSSPPPVVTVTNLADTIEGGTPGAYRFARTGSTSQSLSVTYLVGGAAIPTDDYVALSGTVTFPVGVATVDVSVTPVNDSVAEYDETVEVVLATSPAYTIGWPGSATVIIADNEQPVVMVEKLYDAVEGDDSSGWFAFSRTGSKSQALTINYSVGGTATDGTDYTTIGTTISIPAGEFLAYREVVALVDGIYDPGETVVAALASGTGYTVGSPSSATVVIADNPPIVVVQKLSDTVESGSAGLFRFARGGDTTQSLTVYYTISGTATPTSDYIALSGSVTFAANSATVDMSVASVNDSTAEPDETVIVTLANGTGYTPGTPSIAAVVIKDNEQAVVSIERVYDAFEGWTGQFQVSRLGDTSSALSVNYSVGGTATPGIDYASIGTSLVLAAGAVSAVLDVSASTDSVYDPDETVIATLSTSANYGIGAPGAATLQIVDNVAPPPHAGPVFDLDVNANGTLTDAVDLAANYLPGYEGSVNKLWTGLSFRTGNYTGGQLMKLVVDGFGTDSPKVKRIEFVIAQSSNLPGFASNRSSQELEPVNAAKDYSFYKLSDQNSASVTRTSTPGQAGGGLAGGQMAATSAPSQ